MKTTYSKPMPNSTKDNSKFKKGFIAFRQFLAINKQSTELKHKSLTIPKATPIEHIKIEVKQNPEVLNAVNKSRSSTERIQYILSLPSFNPVTLIKTV